MFARSLSFLTNLEVLDMNLGYYPEDSDFDELADSLAQLQKLRKFEVQSGTAGTYGRSGKNLNWPHLFDGLSRAGALERVHIHVRSHFFAVCILYVCGTQRVAPTLSLATDLACSVHRFHAPDHENNIIIIIVYDCACILQSRTCLQHRTELCRGDFTASLMKQQPASHPRSHPAPTLSKLSCVPIGTIIMATAPCPMREQ